MPDPNIIAAAAQSGGNPTAAFAQMGANIAQQGLTGIFTALTNKKARKWQLQDYQRQRNDALADWRMMADYNSPAAQMARLKAAGLNPNLVYGSGADAQVNSMPRSADTRTVQPMQPEFNVGSVLGSYYDARIKEAQIDNLQAQNMVILEEAKLKAINAAKAASETKLKDLNYKFRDETYFYDLQKAKYSVDIMAGRVSLTTQQVEKLKQDTQYTIDENKRKWQMQRPTYEKAVQEVLNTVLRGQMTQQQIQVLTQQARILSNQGDLWDQKINPNDWAPFRRIQELLNIVWKIMKGSE